MKYIIIAALIFFSVGSFAKERVIEPTLLNPNTPFTNAGEIANQETDLGTRIEVNKVEKGVLNGVHYEIYYSDGSGTFSGSQDGQLAAVTDADEDWSVSCKKDAINDEKSCSLYRKNLYILLDANGRLKVFVAGTDDQYPGTSVSVRVDSRTAVRSPNGNDGFFTRTQSQGLIRQLLSGSKVATRYVGWPSESNIDSSFKLYGFAEAYKYLGWAVKQIK